MPARNLSSSHRAAGMMYIKGPAACHTRAHLIGNSSCHTGTACCRRDTHQWPVLVKARWCEQHDALQAVRLLQLPAHDRVHEQRGTPQAVPHCSQPVELIARPVLASQHSWLLWHACMHTKHTRWSRKSFMALATNHTPLICGSHMHPLGRLGARFRDARSCPVSCLRLAQTCHIQSCARGARLCWIS